MFDFEDMEIDPARPGALVAQLLDAAKSGDKSYEKSLLDALDSGIEEGVTAAGHEAMAGKPPRSFTKWFTFLLDAVAIAVEKDPSLDCFEWLQPGKERWGAAILRRLFACCGSSSFNSVRTLTLSEKVPAGLVLMCGKGGGSFADMRELGDRWQEVHNFTVIQSVKCAFPRLCEKQVDQILRALLEHNIGTLGLVVHAFSENGHSLWLNIMRKWNTAPPKGLPPLDQVLRGCIYDSCSAHAKAALDTGAPAKKTRSAEMMEYVRYWYMHVMPRAAGKQSSIDDIDDEDILEVFAKHYTQKVALRSVMGMAQVLLPSEDEHLGKLDPRSAVAKAFHVNIGRNRRGLQDDPVFGDFFPEWHALVKYEPKYIPRICFYSAVDQIVPAQGIEKTAEWSSEVRGAEIKMVLFEKTGHCLHHVGEPDAYFSHLDAWVSKLEPCRQAGASAA